MKKEKIIFWTSTAIVSMMMIFSGYSYLFSEAMKIGFVNLGFPEYFRIELGIAKIIGSIILLIPLPVKRIKEFTYHGFIIVFCSAFITHLSRGDEFSKAIMPIIFLGILIISYIYYDKIEKQINIKKNPEII